MNDLEHADREALRNFLSKKFANDHKEASVQSYNAIFERVKGLMQAAPLFDMATLPEEDRRRYGPGTFGMHTLLARHLIENGSTFVMVANGMPWDCHVFNHETHQMLVPELDRIVFHLIQDLEQRSMLDDTLVLIMGEFGRTPNLNEARGRDHYPNAWSLAMQDVESSQGRVWSDRRRRCGSCRSSSRSTSAICNHLPSTGARSSSDL